MTPIQIILLVSFGAAFLVSLALLVTRSLSPTLSLTGAFVSLLACFAIAVPDETTSIAKLLGIERGVNLLVYVLSVVVFFGFLAMYVRLRRVRADLTRLVREIAIDTATPGPANHRSPVDGHSAHESVDEARGPNPQEGDR